MEQVSEVRLGLKRRFSDFLEQEFEDGFSYRNTIAGLWDEKLGTFARRLVVDSAHLRSFDANLLRRLVRSPAEGIPPFEDALKEFVKSSIDNMDWQKQLQRDDEMFVGLKGDFGHQEVSPRNLQSAMLGQLVKVRLALAVRQNGLHAAPHAAAALTGRDRLRESKQLYCAVKALIRFGIHQQTSSWGVRCCRAIPGPLFGSKAA